MHIWCVLMRIMTSLCTLFCVQYTHQITSNIPYSIFHHAVHHSTFIIKFKVKLKPSDDIFLFSLKVKCFSDANACFFDLLSVILYTKMSVTFESYILVRMKSVCGFCGFSKNKCVSVWVCVCVEFAYTRCFCLLKREYEQQCVCECLPT